jgi:hypothetical protein
VHAHLANAIAMREDLEAYLAEQAIPYEVYSHVTRDGADFWRYGVPNAHIIRARAGVPLKLRGFRVVQEGGAAV